MVMLSDALPTGFECGVLNGNVKPGDTIAIIGAGPVGLAVLLTAQFYSPGDRKGVWRNEAHQQFRRKGCRAHHETDRR